MVEPIDARASRSIISRDPFAPQRLDRRHVDR
jgi:hypothetical protein